MNGGPRRSSLKNPSLQSSKTANAEERASDISHAAVIYVAAFVIGAIVMSFEMLGSRYLNPYFGSSIYTWAALISTILAALTAGYFLGGRSAISKVTAAVLGAIITVASLYLLVLPSFADNLLKFVSDNVDNVRLGGLYSALAIMFVPATLLGVYSPFAIRLVLRTALSSGTVSGAIYGVSTAGSIVGTLGTTFFLIPLIGTRAITLLLGAAGIFCGVCLMALERLYAQRKLETLAILAVLVLSCGGARSEALFDESVRAQMLKHQDGPVAHVETEYNNVYIGKNGPFLSMTTMVAKRWLFESIVNLKI